MLDSHNTNGLYRHFCTRIGINIH